MLVLHRQYLSFLAASPCIIPENGVPALHTLNIKFAWLAKLARVVDSISDAPNLRTDEQVPELKTALPFESPITTV